MPKLEAGLQLEPVASSDASFLFIGQQFLLMGSFSMNWFYNHLNAVIKLINDM